MKVTIVLKTHPNAPEDEVERIVHECIANLSKLVRRDACDDEEQMDVYPVFRSLKYSCEEE